MLAAGAAMVALLGASPAFAARTFNLVAVSNNFTINAVLTTTDRDNRSGYQNNTGYRITDITGTLNNRDITGLLAPIPIRSRLRQPTTIYC